MILRPYQDQAVKGAFDAWQTSDTTLVVMPTGTGKTVVLASVIANRPPGKAMLMAHRAELIWQGAKKIHAVTGEHPDIEMAEYVALGGIYSKDVVVSSVQSLNAGKKGKGRMTRFDPMEFSLLIIDEAHHATARGYRKVIDYFRKNPALKVLGVTATPDRTDEEALGQIFSTVAFDYDLVDAIHDGWLVPIMQRSVYIEGLDYSTIRTRNGDLNGDDLARVLEYEENLHAIAGPTLSLAGARRTLVFAASVEQARRLTEIFNRHRDGCARFVYGETPPDERREMFANYAAGRFQFLVNVGVSTEGFDDPGIEVVVMARPTKSRSLYSQMAGRGTRPLPGIVDGLALASERLAAIAASAKPGVEIIDFVGNCGRHKLITTADILGGKRSPEVVERARGKAAGGGKPVDMLEAMDEAERELQEEKERARRLQLRVHAKFTSTLKDPFVVLGVEPWVERGWNKGRQPTENQLATLERAGVEVENVKTFTQASQLIDTLIKRRGNQQCTFKQAKLLARYGYPTDMTFDDARGAIDALAANNWKRPGTPKPQMEVF